MRLLFDFFLIWFLLTILCLIHNAKADSVEVIGGSLTYHVIDFGTADAYANKIGNSGKFIDNPLYGVAYTQTSGIHFNTSTVFSGQNSLGGMIYGGLYAEGLNISDFQVGLAAGAYTQESKPYSDLNIISYRLANINGVDLVPVAGVIVNYKINLYKNTYIKLNNLISPVIINSTLAVGYNF